MDFKVNYTVVGLFVILLSAVLIVLFFWLSTFKHDKKYNTYLVYMSEEVTGLSVQGPVRFNGVPVGFVKDIELDPDNPQLVELTLQIEENTPITTSTVAKLNIQGITGVLYVSLKAETIRAPILKAKPGEKYPIIPSKPSLFMELSEVLPEITKNMKSIGESVSKLLDEENRIAIKNSLQNIATFSESLADNTENINASLKYLKKTLKNSSVASEELPAVVNQLKTTLKSLEKMSDQMKLASRSANTLLQESHVAVMNLSTQVVPSVQQVMMHLNSMTSNLTQITYQLERNPSILIRGKRPLPLGPGEK